MAARLLADAADDTAAGVEAPEGSQLKVNLLLRRLPGRRSGVEPATAFAGTLHLGRGYARLDEAYGQAAAGVVPDPLPSEVYCHTLTDPSILGADLRMPGGHIFHGDLALPWWPEGTPQDPAQA